MSIAATKSVVPVSVTLKVYRDAAYAATVELFEDEARTKAFDLSGWTVELDIAGIGGLEEGGGLTVKAPNTIEMVLSAAVTVGYPVGKFHFVLWVFAGDTRLPAMNGIWMVQNP